MSQSEPTEQFILTVCKQIKTKDVLGSIIDELLTHIEDQKSTYIKNGMDDNTAEEKAVEQMGNPMEVGEYLNQIHRPKRDWIGLTVNIIMWIIAGSIFIFGFLMGVGLLLVMVETGNFIFGIIIGSGFTAFGGIIAVTVVNMGKFISNSIYYYSLVRDFRRRNKRKISKLI
ncbi:MAG: permease prefix domain 1-containing protein [Oscillospiraceae bacterium]|nr:permease prefix domain 1-containing protein [Oscillospiraceae bacterium]